MHYGRFVRHSAFAAALGFAGAAGLAIGSPLPHQLAPGSGAIRPAGEHGAASPIPCPSNPFPCGNGDIVDYTETGAETITNPSGSTTYDYSATYAILQACPAAFNGYTNLCDWQFTFTDNPGLVQNAYYGYLSDGNFVDLDVFGDLITSSDGVTVTSDVDKYDPPSPVDKFPQMKGNKVNILDQLYQANESTYGPHGYRSTLDLRNPRNGTYRETYAVNNPGAHAKLNQTWILRGDGSGEFDTVQNGSSPSSSSTTFGTPSQIGSQWVIPVTVTTPSGSTTTYVADWLPGGQTPPKRFQTFQYVDRGVVLIPAICGAWAGQAAEDLHVQQFYILDPIQGVYQVGTVGDVYVVDGSGYVCANYAYTVGYYDNTTTGTLYQTISNAYTDVLVGQVGTQRRATGRQGQTAQALGAAALMRRESMHLHAAFGGLIGRRIIPGQRVGAKPPSP